MRTILIVFGLLVAVAVLASGENHEESSLSEELGSSRVARSSDAEEEEEDFEEEKEDPEEE